MVFLGHSIVFYYSSLWVFYATVLTDIRYTVVAIYHSKLTSEGISSPSFPICKCKATPEGEFPLTADGLAPPPHMSASCRCVKNADGPVPRRRCLRAGALCSQISPLPRDVTTRKWKSSVNSAQVNSVSSCRKLDRLR